MGYKNSDVESEYRKIFEAQFEAQVDKLAKTKTEGGMLNEQFYAQAGKIAAESANREKVFLG
jgi:hypothetical protein